MSKFRNWTTLKHFIRNLKLGIGHSQSAFTLIELLVVIAIIGILISIAAVGWVSVSMRGRDSTRKSDLARIKQVLQQQYSDTRTYPVFDYDSNRIIYAANWQLTNYRFDEIFCNHDNQIIQKLAPKYIASIPIDPRDNFNYPGEDCDEFTKNQSNRYIYISSPTKAGGPAEPATGFGLMATLETSQNDWIANTTLNPLHVDYTGSAFKWYKDRGNYDLLGVNANYFVDSRNQ